MSVNLTVSAAPHIRGKDNTRRLMLDVLIALAPALIAAVYFYGERALVLTVISVAACVVCEALICLVMRRPVSVGDLSAVVTGVLLAFSVPHSCPYWALVAGDAFAIIVVKGLVGGLGQNVFNPALAGRAFMMLLWPSTITRYGYTYVAPFEFGTADIVASSTPLQTMARSTLPDVSIFDMLLGNGVLGCIGEVCNLALLIGLAWLLYRKVISWRIPVAYLGAVAVLTLVFSKGDDALAWMLYSVLGGGVMLGAIFMATDYATSPTLPVAQLVYGIGCGVLTVVIRYFGIFPEGVTYAILIMNACAWAFDKAFPIRRFGVVKGGAGK
ncbi:MAG TPA: RnfABCDGE type electron transport complex subunit D [Candidatus Scatomorpha stercorigallinarum]|nr:RnfABCDGE type electron transport complex subunit D [Candidatus Scatomorpha stercorigallinarum]